MTISDFVVQLDQHRKEQDALYHQVAVQFGLTDTAMLILYLVSECPDGCTQQELCHKSFYAKQTIHTALSSLVRDHYAVLEPIPGTRNQKKIRLTDRGWALTHRTTDLLHQAELRAYSRLDAGQVQTYLDITEAITTALREEFAKIHTEGARL